MNCCNRMSWNLFSLLLFFFFFFSSWDFSASFTVRRIPSTPLQMQQADLLKKTSKQRWGGWRERARPGDAGRKPCRLNPSRLFQTEVLGRPPRPSAATGSSPSQAASAGKRPQMCCFLPQDKPLSFRPRRGCCRSSLPKYHLF